MRLTNFNRGFTLLELIIVMAIVAIGVALAAPTYENVMQRRHTTAQAEELAAFLAYAQSEAVKQNTVISVQLTYTDENNWCIGADESITGCNCTGVVPANLCTIKNIPKTMGSATQERSSMVAPVNGADLVFAFDPVRGTMIEADLANLHTFTLQSDNTDYELQVDVAPTGRIKICNSDSTKAVPGYKSCS